MIRDWSLDPPLNLSLFFFFFLDNNLIYKNTNRKLSNFYKDNGENFYILETKYKRGTFIIRNKKEIFKISLKLIV